jgi:glycosyltransferase involved in cell wall biosynthesis
MTALMSGSARGLRVAHLIETDGPGGAENVVVQLATALQEDGARNVVFLPENGEGWLGRQLEGTGVEIDHFHLEKPFSPLCSQLLAESFRRHCIDVAHSHEFSMAIYGAWAAWRAGIPHLITMHGKRYYLNHLRRRVALRVAMTFSARTVAVSETLTRTIAGDLWFPPSYIQTIPNGVQYVPPAKVTLREELGLSDEDTLTVSIGNLYPVKGHQHLIDALALIADRHPRLHMAIAGRGELEEPLRARAKSHGLETRVHLLGLRADVPAILAAGDVFVLPSLSEGLPLALLEAMFAGCPIVASDVGEIATALGHGDAGMLVEAGNPRAVASALDAMLSDRPRATAMGARAAARARAEYDISRMVRRYLDLYQTLTAAPSAVPPMPAAQAAGLDGRHGR